MSDIETIELSITEAKRLVEKKDNIEKLMRNREFRKIFEDGYFTEEAARLVAVSADPQMAEQRDDIFLQIQAISKVKQYLRHSVMIGHIAERDLAEQTEVLDEMRSEGMEFVQ